MEICKRSFCLQQGAAFVVGRNTTKGKQCNSALIDIRQSNITL